MSPKEASLFSAAVGVAQVEAFGEVAAQLGRHQQAAEGRFAHSLHGTHQDGRHAIGTFAARVVPHPACCQSQHPAVERAYPQRIVRYPGSQRRHPVATVPGGQRVEVTGKGMVAGHVVRLHVAAHVAVPAVDAFGDGGQCNAVQQAVVHRLIYKVVFVGSEDVAQSAFGLLRQAVVAEGIAQAQEAQQVLHGLLLLRGLPLRGSGDGRSFSGSGGRFLMHRFGGSSRSVCSASFGVGSSLAVRSLQRTSPFRPSSRKTSSVPAGSVEQKCCRYSNTCSYDCVRRREGAERCTSVSRFRTRLIRFFAVFIVYFVFLCVCTQAKIRQISGLPNRFGQTRSTNRFQLHVSTQTNDEQTVTLKGERWAPQRTQRFTAFFMERR